MKTAIPKIRAIVAEISAEEDSKKKGLLIANAATQIQQMLPKHLDSIEMDDWCRTLKYFILRVSRSPEFGEQLMENFSIYAAYNLMRIEKSEMAIHGSQSDRLVKLATSAIAVKERTNSYFKKHIEANDPDFEGIYQEVVATLAMNFDGNPDISDRMLFNLLLQIKLNILENQYALLMAIHKAITGFDEVRALKELIHLYSKLIQHPRKQLDLFQAPFLEKSLMISKETANEYCIRALEIFSDKLTILEPSAIRLDLDDLRSKYLPQYKSCFICYTEADEDVAQFLFHKLKGRGIECWLDKHEILPGDNLQSAIDKAIKANDKMIMVCSKKALSSWWVKDELSKAIERERTLDREGNPNPEIIIPINLDGYVLNWEGPNANLLKDRNILDFRGWNRSHRTAREKLEKLLQTLLINKYYDSANLPEEPF